MCCSGALLDFTMMWYQGGAYNQQSRGKYTRRRVLWVRVIGVIFLRLYNPTTYVQPPTIGLSLKLFSASGDKFRTRYSIFSEGPPLAVHVHVLLVYVLRGGVLCETGHLHDPVG